MASCGPGIALPPLRGSPDYKSHPAGITSNGLVSLTSLVSTIMIFLAEGLLFERDGFILALYQVTLSLWREWLLSSRSRASRQSVGRRSAFSTLLCMSTVWHSSLTYAILRAQAVWPPQIPQ